MVKGYIFDLDGVLVDTAKYHYDSWRQLANSLGFDITLEQNEELKGVSRMESLEFILNIGGKSMSTREKMKLAALKNKWYVDKIASMDASELLPGTKELLEDIQKCNGKIALGSASKNSVKILKATGIYKYFEVIIDGNKTTESKPHPQVFLMGAKALGLEPRECIVFEDSKKGVEAANTGGFISIGIGDDQSLADADYNLKNLKDVKVDRLMKLINPL